VFYELVGRLDPLELFEFFDRVRYRLTEQQIFDEYNQSQDDIKRVAKKYDFSSWLAINQLVPIPVQDWLGKDPWFERHGLDDMLKKAIAHEVENIVRERESHNRQAERKMEMQRMEQNSKLQFPQAPTSSTSRFF
jgi:hypothetical protein